MKIINLALCFLLLVQTSACSVVFAASGSEDPDLSKIKPGQTRLVVEQELGSPAETKTTKNGSSSLYVYKIGDKPDTGRAILYLIGDIFTFCLAEYIFTPLEIANSGDAHELIVDYNKNDRVAKIRKPVSSDAVDQL